MVVIVLGGLAGCGSGTKASATNKGSAFSEAMTTLAADKSCNGIPTAPGCIGPYRAACQAATGSVPGEPHQRELMCSQVTEAEAKLAEAPSKTTPAEATTTTGAETSAQELGRAEERERIRTNPENLPPEEAREANREREEKSQAASAGISERAVVACSQYGLAGYKRKCEQRWQAEENAGRTPAPEKPNPNGSASETEEAAREGR